MREIIADSAFFGCSVSLLAYFGGVWLKKKLKSSLVNPLLIAIIVTILVLIATKTDYASYNAGAKYLSWFLTPATVCLAYPLYEQFEALKKNALAVMAGILSGVIMSCLSVFLLALVFGFSHADFVTFLPKSVTTAIGMGISSELGGYVSVTVVMIIVTGVTGNVIAETVLRLFHITEPVAKGIAIGTASHAVGTAKANDIGEIEGAMSGLSIVVAGLMTVIIAPLFSGLL